MNTLLDTVESMLLPYLKGKRQVLLALSGGLDSRVLLELLIQLRLKSPFELKAVHVHHGLSQHAEYWATQCRKWCQDNDVEYALERVSLVCDKGESIENVARTARYQVLAKHLQADGCLLTAQHSDDQVETFLLALKRGSGPKGLSAMASSMPFSHGYLLRPLLSISRTTIHDYATDIGLSWVEDESNLDTRFDRNFIRHNVTPVITQRWPHFSTALQRSAELCAQQERLLDELLQERLDSSLGSDNTLSICALNSMSDAVRGRVLRMWLSNLGLLMPSQTQLKQLWSDVAMAKSDANPKFILTGHEVRRFNQYLVCIPSMSDVSDWMTALTINQPLVLPNGLGKITLFDTVTKRNGLVLSRKVLNGKLAICFNPEGRRAHPQGKVGHKTLKKWYQEFEVPSWKRRRTPILLYNETVAAVANLYVDQQCSGEDCELVWE